MIASLIVQVYKTHLAAGLLCHDLGASAMPMHAKIMQLQLANRLSVAAYACMCSSSIRTFFLVHIIFIRNFSTPSIFCECSQFLYSLFYHKHQLAQHDSKVTVCRTAVSTYGPVFAPDFAWFHTAREKGTRPQRPALYCKKYHVIIITTSNIM